MAKKRTKFIAAFILADIVVMVLLLFFVNERFPEYMPTFVKKTLAQNSVSGFVTHVRDGDTIEVAETPIRFGSLDCAELGTPEGDRARDIVRSISFGRTLTCYAGPRKSHDRDIGSCTLEDGTDLASKMIEGDYCERYLW